MPHPLLPSRRELLEIKQAPGSHRVGLRAALSVAVPLFVLIAIGHLDWTPYAAFGAFASLYGRKSAHFDRVQMQASAGTALTAAVTTGVLVGLLPGALWLQVLTGTVIAATGEVIARAHRYHPPGPIFMVFAFGAISSMPHTSRDLLIAPLVAGATALFAMLVGVAGAARRPRHALSAWRELELLRATFTHNWKPAWVALAVAVSGSIAVLLGIGHPYWAMVAAVAPLSAPHVTSQVARAIQRTIGTTVGLLGAGLLLGLHLSPLWTVTVVMVLQLLTELVVARNYAIAMLFITPMALLVGSLGHRPPIATVLFDRGVETFIGSTVGMAVVILGHLLRERRKGQVAGRLAELARERGQG